MSLLLRRDRRANARADKKAAAKNPWDRPLPGVDEGDPHSVQAGLHSRLGDLAALAERIRGDDRHIQRRAQDIHDHHRDHAAHLEAEIAHVGVGNDPVLENAHAHHLAGRQVAEEVLAKLRDRLGSA